VQRACKVLSERPRFKEGGLETRAQQSTACCLSFIIGYSSFSVLRFCPRLRLEGARCMAGKPQNIEYRISNVKVKTGCGPQSAIP